MARPKFHVGEWFHEGMRIDVLNFKAPEDPEDKAARIAREKWSFVVMQLSAYLVSYLFLIVVGVYCCFVAIRYGVESPAGRTVLPLLTTLLGGVLGVIVGKASK